MYESESSTFEAKFKPSVAICLDRDLPYPGNERSAAPIEKDVGSANQSIHAVVRIGVKEATSSRKSGEVVGGISKISRLLVARVQKSGPRWPDERAGCGDVPRHRDDPRRLTAQEANAAHPFIERAPMEEHNAFDIPMRRSTTFAELRNLTDLARQVGGDREFGAFDRGDGITVSRLGDLVRPAGNPATGAQCGEAARRRAGASKKAQSVYEEPPWGRLAEPHSG